jgi:hypothetical protein
VICGLETKIRLSPFLEEISITNCSFANLRVSRLGDDFAALRRFYINGLDADRRLRNRLHPSPDLETVVLIDLTAASLSVTPVLGETDTFAVYIDNLDLSNNPFIRR